MPETLIYNAIPIIASTATTMVTIFDNFINNYFLYLTSKSINEIEAFSILFTILSTLDTI